MILHLRRSRTASEERPLGYCLLIIYSDKIQAEYFFFFEEGAHLHRQHQIEKP